MIMMSIIFFQTEKEHLIIYHLVVPTDIKTLYELLDPPTPSLKRESDELFVKELIPPLIFSLAFEVFVEGGISDLVAIREELMIGMISTKMTITCSTIDKKRVIRNDMMD